MPNQRDVAKYANVSSATISRYVNNPKLLSPKVADRVKDAIEKLGYRPDYSARVLKTGKFQRIGIIAASNSLFYMEVLSSIEKYLSEKGYFINFYFSREQSETGIKAIELVKSKQVDGFLIFPRLIREDDEIIEYLKSVNEKFIIIDRYIEDNDIYQVKVDNYDAGKSAARYLLEKGHKNFLFIWGKHDTSSAQERYNGFVDVLNKKGIKLSENRQIKGEFEADITYETVKQNFQDLPEFSAVFASNDLSAMGFIKAASEFNRYSSKDFDIIGFDDDRFSEYLIPSLSTFRQPLTEMGTKAAEMLINLIEGKKVSEKKISLKSLFVKRDSC
jgi:LacI family transcriptional regulator